MPTKRTSKLVKCRYFSWLLSLREGVWQADGRSNSINAGRHSLDTRDKKEAEQFVHELDEEMAIKIGLIERRAPRAKTGLTISDAVEDFRKAKQRPIASGGVEPQTLGRYNRILNKFEAFVSDKRVKFVSEIDIELFDDYVAHLEELDFALSTITTELVLLKSVHQHCLDKKLLDPKFAFKFALKRPGVSLTYCPADLEINEILRICKADKSLDWLFRVVSVLSNTGLRFGEARDIEWRDIDKDFKLLHVRDETYLRGVSSDHSRKTKTRRARKIPIYKDLVKLFKAIEQPSGRVLFGPRGGKLRNDIFGDTLRAKVYPEVIEKVGNDDVMRLTAHGFRHYFVSRCANLGVPQLSVMKWLGHRTSRMTNYYYHSNEAASLLHMRQFEAAIEAQSIE